MKHYKSRPILVEAMDFDELVAYGIEVGGNVVDGYPWSFKVSGHAVTHENNDCYLVNSGNDRFERGEMLVIFEDRLCVYGAQAFADEFELVGDGPIPKLDGNQNVRDNATGELTHEWRRLTEPDKVTVETDR